MVVVDAVSALQAQIEQLKKEKSDLMSRSFAELQEREGMNRALDVKVQRLMKQIDELNKEADDLMVLPTYYIVTAVA